MSVDPEELTGERPEPVAHVRIVYAGAVAPHWDIQGIAGDGEVVDEFRQRAVARLQLLPPHDPQFRRNRERVNRDAERENVALEWDLGYEEGDVDATALGDKPIGDVGVVPVDEETAVAEVEEEEAVVEEIAEAAKPSDADLSAEAVAGEEGAAEGAAEGPEEGGDAEAGPEEEPPS